MKKIFMLAVTVMMLAVSAVCSAANGKVLDAEEAIAEKFISGGDYKAVSSLMSADMQQNWNETVYANMQEQIAKTFGKLTTNRLRIIQKLDDADVLIYQVVSEKIPTARFVYVFVVNGEKPLLKDFTLGLPQQEEPAGQQQAGQQ
ncbi:MAG: hypothetical protein Q4E64_07775 [Phascolarctobacterium sp.]|uniref:hypothetical protein n=1 Tax=Phascolarctobacterium sp. TaxID=2049039 RepID=UPI0026DD5666|nr:hypothetical protein [Phascolarctobacterium sp.]MDO4921710.1 hypothetical protein [Phascolarctobacterium sp.]